MSTWLTPEIASAFGALDGAAFTDGRALDALTLRTMAMQANRLISVGHQAFNLVWPEQQVTFEGVSQYFFDAVASPSEWEMLHPPITFPKLPGLDSGKIYIRANIPSGDDVIVGVETGRSNRDDLTATLTGTGSFANYSISSVPFDLGAIDQLTLWFRGGFKGDLMNTTTYGTLNTGSAALSASPLRGWGRDYLVDASNNWNTGAGNLAEAGHYIQIVDDYGGSDPRVMWRRKIVALPLSDRLEWGPALTRDVFLAFRAAIANTAVTTQWEIRKLPTIAVSQIMCVLDSRTP